MMSKSQCAIKVENDEETLHTTPDLNDTKYGNGCKDGALAVSPFHLLDHGYGRTPQSQLYRRGGIELGIHPSRNQTGVKRRLNLEASGDEDSIGFKTPKSRRKSNSSKSPSPRGQSLKLNRYDTSLGLLTKKFVKLLQMSPRGIVDLNFASRHLDVQKRRIYDITNVLEGIGILEKRSKNNIQWRGGNHLSGSPSDEVQRDIENLEKEEKNLDDLIRKAQNDFEALSKDDEHSYIRYQDLRNLKALASRTIMVIKAPSDTHLEVPRPDSPTRREMFLRSENGEIEVFLCPDHKALKDDPERSEEEAIVPSTSNDSLYKSNHESKAESLKKLDRYHPNNALISAADDYQSFALQTEDQHSSDLDNSLCDDFFLSIQPPMDSTDYLFSMASDEGLNELFSL